MGENYNLPTNYSILTNTVKENKSRQKDSFLYFPIHICSQCVLLLDSDDHYFTSSAPRSFYGEPQRFMRNESSLASTKAQ